MMFAPHIIVLLGPLFDLLSQMFAPHIRMWSNTLNAHPRAKYY